MMDGWQEGHLPHENLVSPIPRGSLQECVEEEDPRGTG